MKIQATLPFLLLATLVSAARGDASSDALAGHWRGVLGDGPAQTVIELQFDQGPAGYRGHFWSAVRVHRNHPTSQAMDGDCQANSLD